MKIARTRIVFDRHNKATKKVAAAIYIEVSYDRVRNFYSTGIKVCSNQFKDGKVINHGQMAVYQERINDMRNTIESYINEKMKAKETFLSPFADRCAGYSIRAVVGDTIYPPNDPDNPAVVAGLCPNSYHPHIIDLGSAGQWSCCNVGSSAPWEYGGLYAWGELTTKSEYEWSNYTHCDGSKSTVHYLFRNIAATEYDVASVEWQGKWAMPSYRQLKGLGDLQRERITVNDVSGMKITASNGNKIFLPYCGAKFEA